MSRMRRLMRSLKSRIQPHCLAARLLVALMVVGIVSCVSARAASGPRIALVMGNGAYRNAQPLANPAHDARAMAEKLQGLGFQVIDGFDLDRAGMEARVRRFADALPGAAVGLFYYAGHGLQADGHNYMLPIDAKLESAVDLSFQAIPLGLVMAELNREPRVRLIFLDACRDNPLVGDLAQRMGQGTGEGGPARGIGSAQGLAPQQAALGSLIAYATQPGAIAVDGEGDHSPFTGALLARIDQPGLELRQMLTEVRGDVVAQTGGRQVPWDHSSLVESFWFQTAETAAVAPAAVPGGANGSGWTDPVTGMRFAALPGGCYSMGHVGERSDEEPVHEVCVEPFQLGVHEVTQGQWLRVMGENPAHFQRSSDHPIENVSWEEAQFFIERLNARGSGGFRLPTEAEWEYACRSGGRAIVYPWGDAEPVCRPEAANGMRFDDDASCDAEGVDPTTDPVGRYRPNPLGLYDMSGNVFEWVADWKDAGFYARSPRDNPVNQEQGGGGRVLRGGSWRLYPWDARCAYRFGARPDGRDSDFGFRLARQSFLAP